ncbi:MAG TPA: amidohydrolase family protein [Terriglobales bacterium]|nr:amidohydrolase family protein [Terriglobales bacterium]
MPIDVHAHYVPPRILEALHDKGASFGVTVLPHKPGNCLSFEYGVTLRPLLPRLLEDESARIDSFMAGGVDRQILSVWSDLFAYGLTPVKGEAWHRLMNDTMAEVCVRHPAHFSFLATGPLQDPARAARELERAQRECNAVGATVAANVMGANLGEAPLDEYWAAASELGLPVLIHPNQPDPTPRVRRWALNQTVHFPYDTTLSVASLIFGGVMDRFPNLKLILPHGGGLIPYLIGRLDHMHARMDRTAEGDVALDRPSAYLDRFHYDTILHHPRVLLFLIDSVGLERIVLGSDDPFPPGVREPVRILHEAGLVAAQIATVTDDNPRKLFKLPQS